MKLKDLFENTNDGYLVYKVSGYHTDKVYYGYSHKEDPKTDFLRNAKRSLGPNESRGAVQWLEANNNDTDIEVQLIDVFIDEESAFEKRNDLRSDDEDSINGPSHFPPILYNAIKKNNPEKVAKWNNKKENMSDIQKLKKMTPRQAIGKYWTMEELKQMAPFNPDMRKDLDKDETAYDFGQKYFTNRISQLK